MAKPKPVLVPPKLEEPRSVCFFFELGSESRKSGPNSSNVRLLYIF